MFVKITIEREEVLVEEDEGKLDPSWATRLVLAVDKYVVFRSFVTQAVSLLFFYHMNAFPQEA